MNSKDLILDFIGYLFMIALIIFAILFFINPSNFEAFQRIMKASIPFSLFGIIFLIKLKLSRSKVREKRAEGNLDIVIYLNYVDKLKSDIIIFGLPVVIILISFFGDNGFDLNDFFQSAIAFLIMYFWQRSIFSKSR